MSSENSLPVLSDQWPLPVCLTDAGTFALKAWNSAFAAMAGPALQKGMPLTRFFPDVAAQYAGVLHAQPLINATADKQRYFDITAAPELEDLLFFFSDVSVHVRHRDSAQAGEQRMEDLIGQATVATALYIGRDMRIQLANEAMLRLWGKEARVIGTDLNDALPELQGQPFFNLLQQVYDSGETYHSREDRCDLVVDGQRQTFYFNFTYKPLFNEAGQVYGILNMAVDVTSLVHTKQELLMEKAHNSLTLEAAEMGTWILYPNEQTVEWDERCQSMFGFPQGDTIAYNDVLSHIHPDDRANVDETVKKALDPAGSGKYFAEFRTVASGDETVRWLRCQGRAYFDHTGRPIRFAGTAQDISGRLEQRSEREKLLGLVRNSSDYMAVANEHGQLTYLNKAGRALVGMPEEADIRQYTSGDFYEPDFFRETMPQIYAALLDAGHWKGTVQFRHFDSGEIIPGEGEFIRINDPITGQYLGRAGTVRDLRPELAAKQALLESEQLLRNITSEAPTGLWMSDEKGRITYVNETWITWTGMPLNDQLGYGWTQVIIAEDKDRALNTFLADVQRGLPYVVDFRIRRADGSIRCMVARGNRHFNAEGDFIGYIGSTTDITDNVENESKLKAINEQLNGQIRQFEFVTDAMPQIVWATRADGYHDFFNARWYSFTGLTYEETKNTGWSKVLHPDDLARTTAVWNESLKTGQPYEIEYRMRRFDGQYRWLLARALPHYGNDRKILKWFGTCTDIHEQKLSEQQKDDFLGIASHELRTPVTSIKAYAQVLEAILTKKGEEKEAHMAAKMNGQINRLTNLISDLLDVTKINSGRMQFNKRQFAFNAMVSEMIEELQRTTHRHTLIEDFGPETYVFGDRERIGQVITNMITNAVKYSPDADRIVIHTLLNGPDVEVCIEDFGVGIAKDKQDRVFEQFYRVSGDMQHTFPGLGLGLYISSEIVKREGGRIWVTSVEGKGSNFCFSIPVDGGKAKKESHI